MPPWQIIGEWIDMINEKGRDSKEAQDFLAQYRENEYIMKLVAAIDMLRGSWP